MSDRTYRSGVEDYASITLQCANGAIAVIETAYTFPIGPQEQREVNFTISSSSGYIRSARDSILVRDRKTAEQRKVEVGFETDHYYALFVDSVLREFRSGHRSVAGLPEAEAVMAVMDAAYRSARSGGALQPVG
jgi:predicted dehydrogenase